MAGKKGPVLVIGATGQQGRATTAHLLEDGWEVRAPVQWSRRTPQQRRG